MKKAKLSLLWLAMGAFPVCAQTGAGLSGVVTDQTGSALRDVAVTTRKFDTGTTKTGALGVYKFSLLASIDYPLNFSATGSRTPDVDWITRGATGMAGLNPLQAQEAKASSQTADTLTWHGITVYGAYDIGLGWVSHGLPVNGYNYEGESLVNRNGYEHRFIVAPNNLQQTSLGVRGKEEFAPGWFVVFNASTGINPNSGLLANASKTDIVNNGLPRSSYSEAIDGARAGQPFNDEYYGGVSSEKFGTLTFGRERSLGTDAMLLYDPAGGSYAFSYIGYNGTMAGGGDTEDSRWDDAVK